MKETPTELVTTDLPASELPAIERTLELKASPERVWRAISDPAELSRWFPTHAELEVRPGGDGRFHFDGYGDALVHVEAVDRPRYLAWRWLGEKPSPEESETLVEWWLEPRADGGTSLRLRESGFRFEKHRAGNEEGWTAELGELVQLLDDTDP